MTERQWVRGAVRPDQLKQRAGQVGQRWSGGAKRGYLKDSISFYNPKEGKNCIRIIPPLEVTELGHYAMDLHIHRNIGPNNDLYLCLLRMFNGMCYPCSLRTNELWESNPDFFKSLYPDWRLLMWVLDLYLPQNDPNYLVPLIYSCPKTLMDEIITQSHRAESDTYLDVSDAYEGVPIYYTRVGTGLKTKYTGVQLGQQAWPLPVELIDRLQPFADVLIIPTSEEVQTAFLGKQLEAKPTAVPPECYQQEYGVYADCPSCDFGDSCRTVNETKAADPEPEPSGPPSVAPPTHPKPAAPAQQAAKPSAPPPKPPVAPPSPPKPAPPRSVPPPRPSAPPTPLGQTAQTGGASDDIRQRLRDTIAKRQAAKTG